MTDPMDHGDPYIEWNEANDSLDPAVEYDPSDEYDEDLTTQVSKQEMPEAPITSGWWDDEEAPF